MEKWKGQSTKCARCGHEITEDMWVIVSRDGQTVEHFSCRGAQALLAEKKRRVHFEDANSPKFEFRIRCLKGITTIGLPTVNAPNL